MKYLGKKIRVGRIYLACNLHPTRCILLDGDEVEGISLIDGSERCCSVLHCGCKTLSQKETEKL